jgi:heme-degrading monooxygenase HmoA
MHAVAIRVSISADNEEDTTKQLREEIVPMVSQMDGFVAGYWVRLEGGNQGTSVVVFESEEGARNLKENLQFAQGVTPESVDVGEVVANA